MNIHYVFIQALILYLQMDKSKLAPMCYQCKLKMTDYIAILKQLVIHHPDKSLSKNNSHTAKYRALHYPHLCKEINTTQYSIQLYQYMAIAVSRNK